MPEHLGDIIISQEDEDIADAFFCWEEEQPSG